MKGRKLLMIPGPIEFEPEVLRSMGTQTASHVSPSFIETFGNCLDLMKKIWLAPNGQAFIVSGSGTLAMDMAAANLVEKGDAVLVISNGYFGERFQDILNRYGANTTLISASIDSVISLDTIEKELKKKKYKLLTMTHVDTSTGILIDPKSIAKLAKKHNVLSILDGVCSVAGEEIKQEDWEIDIVLTASQKAIGVPPGLALLVASKKAIQIWENRKTPVQNYYSDWENWLPIMHAYQERRPSYFGTPPVNLIAALETSLKIIEKEGIENRVNRHQKLASAFRSAIISLGLHILPSHEKIAANTLTAIYYPEKVNGSDFISKMNDYDIIIAGGLLPSIKTTYFRIGHMGSVSKKDFIATLSALEYALHKTGHIFKLGIGIQTFQKYLFND